MKKILILSACAIMLSGCIFTDKSDVQHFAIQEGWSSAQYNGYSFFSCAENDWYHTGFTAIKNGQQISGTICRGLFFKNATIRYN